MARWAVVFSDKPEMAAIRATLEPAHLDFLRAHRDRILIAGGLRPEPGAPFSGGLWIVEAQSRDEVLKLVAQDPYYDPAVRDVTVALWGRPFPEPVTL